MPSLDHIKSEILKADLVIGKQVVRRVEISSLPKILFNNESIQAVLTGKYKDQDVIVIGTNQRILTISSSSWAQFPYGGMLTIKSSKTEFEDGKRLDTVQFSVPEGKVEIRRIPFDSSSFTKVIRGLLLRKSDTTPSFPIQKTTPKKSKGKKWVIYSISILFLSVILYFSIGLFSNKSTETSIGYTPSQFQDRWNAVGRDLHSEFIINNLEEVSDGQDQSFTYFLTPELKMLGIIDKNGKIKKIVIIGKPTSNVPTVIEQTLTVVQENLSRQDRETLLRDLGIFNDKKEDRQITKSNIRYSIIYPEKIGIDFEASAIGK